MGRRKSECRGERGSVLAVSALGMLALILAAGLAVDISHLYVVKAELQKVRDVTIPERSTDKVDRRNRRFLGDRARSGQGVR